MKRTIPALLALSLTLSTAPVFAADAADPAAAPTADAAQSIAAAQTGTQADPEKEPGNLETENTGNAEGTEGASDPSEANKVVDKQEGIGYTVSNATQNFSGEAQKLSLEDAITRMQTESVKAKTAQTNKQGDQNKADGYGDSYSSIREALKYMDGMSLDMQYSLQDSVNETNKQILSLQRNFARDHIETNYQAELNAIKLDTIKTYYGLLQAEDNLRIQRENLQVQKNILDMTQKKFQQGVVARLDLLTAQNAVVKAENDVLSANNMVAQAKMGVNTLLENPLMQEIQLTTSYEQLPLPTISLTDAINSAMKNRNELTSVEFALKVQTINYASTRVRYGTRSTRYKDETVNMMQIQQACDAMPGTIEMDIRTRYADIHEKYEAVAAAKQTLEFAQEGYRIANVSYNAGVNTISDVQEAQVGVHSANLGLSAAIAAYNQAVYEFEIAIGIGTERISF